MTELSFRGIGGAGRAPRMRLAEWWQGVDRWSLGTIAILFAIGLVLALAASPPLAEKNGLWTYHYVVRHAVFAVIALCAMIWVAMADLRLIRRGGVLMFLAFWAAIAMLPWAGTDFGKGAVRWYSLGVLSFQPSEFLKPAFVIAAAWLMAGSHQRGGPPGRLLSGVIAIAIAAMLALQPDFGQAMLVMAVWTAMLFVSGASMLAICGIGGLIGVAAIVAYSSSDHFARRIDGFLAPEVAPRTQLAYAESAIREGGLFGVGAAQGSVKSTVPDAHTDLIIAVAAEEFGLVMMLGIAALYLFLVLRCLARLIEERDIFVRLAGTGLAIAFGLQAFVNMGVAIRLLPAKGMTLPLLSYGGSSMIAAALGLGALLAMTRVRSGEGAASARAAP